jgi:hypothetical protein
MDLSGIRQTMKVAALFAIATATSWPIDRGVRSKIDASHVWSDGSGEAEQGS